MDRKSITFFKLISPYPEDITKNCGLVGQELDTNFLHLKEMDIIEARRDGYKIVLKRVDGQEMSIDLSQLLSNTTTDFSVAYDKDNGIIIINYNGKQAVIDGLITTENLDKSALKQVISDSTLYGKGNSCSPLRISPAERTGTFAPVKRLIDLTDSNASLPSFPCNIKGDRYITRELVDDFGKLYDYNAVKRIQCDLQTEGKGWRIPTKEDWDGMLNAIEICDEDRNHDSINGNIQTGKFAGKFLKSKKYWKLYSGSVCNTDDYLCGCDHDCTCHDDLTHTCTCNCTHDLTCPPKPITPNGVDAFGFGAVPSGYGDGCQLNGYFKERAMFWTYTMSHVSDVYVKRFDYDKATAVQEIVSPNTIASIRLVKDYDGSNHFDTECILGQDYHTVLMPSKTSKTGYQIWTDVNVSFTNCAYCPKEPNGGLGLPIESTYPTYNVIEWDGFRWIKNELQEGDSVVLLSGLNGDSNVEYRVINGELVSVTALVFDLVVKEYDPQIKDLQSQICTINNSVAMISADVTNLKTSLNDTNDKLNQEIADRAKADSEIVSKIQNIYEELTSEDARIAQLLADEAGERAKQDASLWNGIQQEASSRQEADNLLWNSINQLSGYTTESLTSLNNKLNQEIDERKSADLFLSNRIDEEINRATSAENALRNALNEEINRATSAENEITKNFNRLVNYTKEQFANVDERITNTAAKLEAEIADEAKMREDADNALNVRVDELNKKVDENISDLTEDFNAKIDDLNKRLQAEYERADAAEKAIDKKVDTEIAERKKAIEELSNKHDTEVSSINSKLDAEIERSVNEDNYIKGKLLSKEGHIFDCANGVLTLKTENEENTITIKLDSNYGTF